MDGTDSPYVAFDEMLVLGPTSTQSPTRSLQSTIKYDMNAHYRFGGFAPQRDRDPLLAPLETSILEFITKQGTPGVMPSENKLRAARQEDLVRGIAKAGGWHKVAKTLGLQISHTLREVYFTCPDSKQAGDEIEFTLPGMPQRFAATIPEGVVPGEEFIVRVPPVLPTAAHGFARGLSDEEAKQRLVLLVTEMDQMKLMNHEIKVIKQALRAKDNELQTLRKRTEQLRASAQTETNRRAELARSLQKASAQCPGIRITAADIKNEPLPKLFDGGNSAAGVGQPSDGQGNVVTNWLKTWSAKDCS